MRSHTPKPTELPVGPHFDPCVDPHFDPRYERRVAWFTALWAAVTVLAVATELWRWVA